MKVSGIVASRPYGSITRPNNHGLRRHSGNLPLCADSSADNATERARAGTIRPPAQSLDTTGECGRRGKEYLARGIQRSRMAHVGCDRIIVVVLEANMVSGKE